jgi:hypothetical protein
MFDRPVPPGILRRSMMERLLPNMSRDSKEPPEPLSFVLGRDRGGHWIVQEAHGLCGGLFVNKAAAMRYARSEYAEREASISVSPEAIELKYSS